MRISASRRVEAPSRHLHESSPGRSDRRRDSGLVDTSRVLMERVPDHRGHTQVDDEQQSPRRVHRRIFADAGFDVLFGAVLLLSSPHIFRDAAGDDGGHDVYKYEL